jgi:hypothetical protein
MKQTAVEWLQEQLKINNYLSENAYWLIDKAKEMEKQQIIDAGNSCALMQHIHNDKINKMTETEIRQFAEEEHLTFGEQYYNETFKNN